MTKTLKRIVSIALMLAMTVIPTFAAVQPAISAAPDFSVALDSYFAVRGETLVSPARRTSTLSTSFSALETTRAQNFAAADENIEVVDATANYVVVNSEVNGNTAVLDVYEWSWLEYYADETVTSTNTMGFGTEHRITLNKVNGEWVMTSDKYDESDITGVSTLAPGEELVLNYDRALLNEVYAATVGAEQLREQEKVLSVNESSVLSNVSAGNTRSVADYYDPHKAIRYADQWVYNGYASGDSDLDIPTNATGRMRPAYYNTAYPYYESDCVNYVSQCLHEGGMLYYTDGAAQNPESYSQWWAKNPNDLNGDGEIDGDEEYLVFDGWDVDVIEYLQDAGYTENISSSPGSLSSAPWRYTPAFVYYWETEQNYEKEIVNKSNPSVYPGNPVFYLYGSGGHAAICVGYNAAGSPIFNSHNRDMYHATFSVAMYTGHLDPEPEVYTFEFVTSSSQNLPNSAHNLGTLTASGTYGTGKYFAAGSSIYFKFTVVTAGNYTMYSESYVTDPAPGLNTFGRLYSESMQSNGKTLYMITEAENNDSGTNLNFSITKYLTPGTYYLQVYPYYMSDSGNAHVYVRMP